MNKFSEKYLKYKFKYLNLKKHFGGSDQVIEECKKCQDKTTDDKWSDNCKCSKCISDLAEAVEDSPHSHQPTADSAAAADITTSEFNLENTNIDSFLIMSEMLNFKDNMSLFKTSKKIQNQFSFNSLLGKFDFTEITTLQQNGYMDEKCKHIIGDENKGYCRLFFNKIQLILLYFKFHNISKTIDSLLEFNFTQKLLKNIIVKSIRYTYREGDTEEKIRHYQNYLYSFLSPENQEACKTVRRIDGLRKELINVTIPDFVQNIGDEAFANNKFTTVTIPNSVKNIGNHAFIRTGLTKVSIGNSVQNIGNSAFAHNHLTEVNIPNSVQNIGDGAFTKNKLTRVTIPNFVQNIRDSAFANNELTTVTIPNTVTNIGNSVFAHNKLITVTIPNTVTNIGIRAFTQNKLTEVTIPNTVENIGDSAFLDNALITVTIGNSVKNIDNYAFKQNKLTEVTIPDSVQKIGNHTFSENKLIKVTIGNSVQIIGDDAFSHNELTNVTIPITVANIGNNAFSHNRFSSIQDVISTNIIDKKIFGMQKES